MLFADSLVINSAPNTQNNIGEGQITSSSVFLMRKLMMMQTSLVNSQFQAFIGILFSKSIAWVEYSPFASLFTRISCILKSSRTIRISFYCSILAATANMLFWIAASKSSSLRGKFSTCCRISSASSCCLYCNITLSNPGSAMAPGHFST